MIRALCEKDIPACLAIYNHYILTDTATFEITPLSPEKFATRVHDILTEDPWIVWEEEGEILGYAYLSPYSEREAFASTRDLSVYVKSEARGRGIGQRLMEEIMVLGRQMGRSMIVSVITCGNMASEKIHQRLGFMKTGELPEVGEKFGQRLGVSFFVKKIEDHV